MNATKATSKRIEMSSSSFRASKHRIPLFIKLVVYFAAIIVFMVLSDIFHALIMQERFMPGRSELQQYVGGVTLSHQLEHSFDVEREAARSYMLSKKPGDSLAFLVQQTTIQRILDSLEPVTEDGKLQAIVKTLVGRHGSYKSSVIQSLPALDTHNAIEKEHKLGDSLRSSAVALDEAYRSSLKKPLNLFDSDFYLFLLFPTIALVFAFMLTAKVTRPIQALKAGTEKVGEGRYETLAISSNDEIADLTHAFNLMNSKLKQLDEMRMQFMSEISHEMRTPLQVIKAGCHAIAYAKDAAKLTQRQVDAVAMIQQATNRINSFVNSFLDIAKMEAGLMEFMFEPAGLIELMEPIVQEAQLIGQARQINVQFFKEDLSPISLDKERMKQVVTNLLSNALKYTPERGTITVSVSKVKSCDGVGNDDKGCVRIDFQDTGVGIPEEDLDKLFNKFYQAKNVPLVKEKGSGLGLALVKHVTEAHGGKVTVKSEVGIGTTFSLLLPA